MGFTPALIALTKREAVLLLLPFMACQRSGFHPDGATAADSHSLFQANVKENHTPELNKLDRSICMNWDEPRGNTRLARLELTLDYEDYMVKQKQSSHK